tara:strand:+ start:1296 stop:1472 length:177 start_codon:yes stop_codon:yes gene_type:complete
MKDEKRQGLRLTLVSSVIRFYKQLIDSGTISPDGPGAKRMERLELEYLWGKRRVGEEF